MSFYVPDESLFVFDAAVPRQYVGAKAYRKNYEDFFAAFPGPLESENTDVAVAASGTLAYSRCIDTWRATDKDGKMTTFAFRVTDVYRKTGGKWLIFHEHVSFPVDFASGKADMLSKP
jgi:ketosteroid isomerase-like protein